MRLFAVTAVVATTTVPATSVASPCLAFAPSATRSPRPAVAMSRSAPVSVATPAAMGMRLAPDEDTLKAPGYHFEEYAAGQAFDATSKHEIARTLVRGKVDAAERLTRRTVTVMQPERGCGGACRFGDNPAADCHHIT